MNPKSELPAHGSNNGAAVPRALHERLRELGINSSGLPPQVLACLRVAVDADIDRIQKELATAIAALQDRADDRIGKQIGRSVTLKSVGKAFAVAASIKAEKASPSASTTGTGGAAK